jgi:hypothetical protein
VKEDNNQRADMLRLFAGCVESRSKEEREEGNGDLYSRHDGWL